MIDFLIRKCEQGCCSSCPPGDCICDIEYDLIWDDKIEEKDLIKKAFKEYKNKECLKQFNSSFAEFKKQFREKKKHEKRERERN